MAEVAGVPASTAQAEDIIKLREQYRCQHFRILVIGRANAGKTTILEKVCGVAKGTKPITILDKKGAELASSETHLRPSIERGMHDIEHQITYEGSNFIFHDSQGFESGAKEEIEVVWNFIEKKSAAAKLEDQLHAIWYCIPMDSTRPILAAELEFFNKGTGRVPLVVAFTKFDGQIIQESGKLDEIKDDAVKWEKARENAQITFQRTYLPKVFSTNYPPKAYVCLEDMDIPEKDCPELTEKTAHVIDDDSLRALFISTQMNNLNLCVKAGLEHVLHLQEPPPFDAMFIIVLSKFAHYWIGREVDQHNEADWFQRADDAAEKEREYYHELEGLKPHWWGAAPTPATISVEIRDKRQKFLKGEILPALFSLFLATWPRLQSLFKVSTEFSATPVACQILAAMSIIAKLSFWIKKPAKQTNLNEVQSLPVQPFEELIRDAFSEFRREGYVKKLKTSITSESLPSDKEDLIEFLSNKIAFP